MKDIILAEARAAHVRELKAELAESKRRLADVEAERDTLLAHFSLGLAALADFAEMGPDATLRIIDGWNAILRMRSVSKLTSDEISGLKAEYLAARGIPPHQTDGEVEKPEERPPLQRLETWIVFDGAVANSYRHGPYRITYTGGIGAHRADRMVTDYIRAAKVLGLDVSRITVETADKSFSGAVAALGAKAEI